MTMVSELGRRAKAASKFLAGVTSAQKDQALVRIAGALTLGANKILQANAQDIEAARANGLTEAMIERLTLNHKRIGQMAAALEELIALPDPVGSVLGGMVRPNGLKISKVRVPMGVIGIIYESRPNVTVDAATLCLKAGSAVILRGGKEAIHSNRALVGIMCDALEEAGFPADCICLIEDTTRQSSQELMRLNGYVDVLIPRRGAGLIQAVVQNATVPVIETGVGNCHVYVDSSADLEMARRIVVNAKAQRPSVCNACETVLVHRDIAEAFLPRLFADLREHGVQLRGCKTTLAVLQQGETLPEGLTAAAEEDYATEFLDYILACRVVDSFGQALLHIDRYSTRHSECIVTGSYANAQRFTAQVDAAAVYVNASTRYTDGGEFGYGAEIGISTQKLHARGPMGLQELTTYKYIVLGDGQTRE